ncbi:hypothetical protein KQI22_12085 [Kineothrix sp. MSJ-39]|uniref:hypothetical protein n=1 Tax=Kineothrix sp. MSJ-39 TaxID=2841533 RepID=UPI001C0FBB96|nr:hypothetical protein [Kineothrix sp. MSJ-39]MBU5430791.1 hypothetical protein [Kineothrix sp. MSJ-39]
MKKKVLGACAAAVGLLLLIAAAAAVWIWQKPETRFLVTMQQALKEKGLLGEFRDRREQGQLAQLDGRYRISLPLLGKKNMEFTAQFSDGTVLLQPTASSDIIYKYVYQDADNQQALQKLLGEEAETQIDFWLSVIEGTENGNGAGKGTGELGKERQKELVSYSKEVMHKLSLTEGKQKHAYINGKYETCSCTEIVLSMTDFLDIYEGYARICEQDGVLLPALSENEWLREQEQITFRFYRKGLQLAAIGVEVDGEPLLTLAEDQAGIPRLDLEQIRIGSDGSLSLELSYLEQAEIQPLQGEVLDIGKLTFTQLPKLFGIF